MKKYRPTGKDLHVLAMVECLLLWNRLSRICKTGVLQDHWGGAIFLKKRSLRWLHHRKVISKTEDKYRSACPFCEYLRGTNREPAAAECEKCIWPGNTTTALRCLDDDYPYEKWQEKPTKENAKAVLDMLLNIEMK